MKPEVTRRRALAVLAGLGLAAGGARAAASAPVLEWRGTALGADATLVFANADRQRAEQALAACLAEINRLERIFSLYLETSEISRLNRHGHLNQPSFDMQVLLSQSLMMHQASEGLFDPTVQAIWEFRRDQAARGSDATGALPASVLAKVGLGKITIDPEEVVLPQGVSISLNGIAQGYITDRVADILRRRGWKDVLIDLGETRALEGRPFDVLIRESGRKISITNGALATSSSAPLAVGARGELPHLFDPRSGLAASRVWSAVTVMHASAAHADALSTALMACGGEDTRLVRRIMSRFASARAWITRPGRDDLVIAT